MNFPDWLGWLMADYKPSYYDGLTEAGITYGVWRPPVKTDLSGLDELQKADANKMKKRVSPQLALPLSGRRIE